MIRRIVSCPRDRLKEDFDRKRKRLPLLASASYGFDAHKRNKANTYNWCGYNGQTKIRERRLCRLVYDLLFPESFTNWWCGRSLTQCVHSKCRCFTLYRSVINFIITLCVNVTAGGLLTLFNFESLSLEALCCHTKAWENKRKTMAERTEKKNLNQSPAWWPVIRKISITLLDTSDERINLAFSKRHGDVLKKKKGLRTRNFSIIIKANNGDRGSLTHTTWTWCLNCV